MNEERLKKAQARLESLLHVDRTHVELAEGDPVLPAAEVGALAAAAYRVLDPEARVTVYFCEDWDAANTLAFDLESRFGGDPMLHVVTGVNGPMAFYGEARLDGPHGRAARFILNDILSAFSGDE